MNFRKKLFVSTVIFALLVGVFISFFHIFITAYTNPDKTVVVAINTVGEADFELGILTAIFLAAMFNIWVYREIIKEVRDRK